MPASAIRLPGSRPAVIAADSRSAAVEGRQDRRQEGDHPPGSPAEEGRVPLGIDDGEADVPAVQAVPENGRRLLAGRADILDGDLAGKVIVGFALDQLESRVRAPAGPGTDRRRPRLPPSDNRRTARCRTDCRKRQARRRFCRPSGWRKGHPSPKCTRNSWSGCPSRRRPNA